MKQTPTISRELRRNAATRGGKLDYRASVAQWKADLVAQRPKTAKLLASEQLRDYVQERLSGRIHRSDGAPVAGPVTASWKAGASRIAVTAAGSQYGARSRSPTGSRSIAALTGSDRA